MLIVGLLNKLITGRTVLLFQLGEDETTLLGAKFVVSAYSSDAFDPGCQLVGLNDRSEGR